MPSIHEAIMGRLFPHKSKPTQIPTRPGDIYPNLLELTPEQQTGLREKVASFDGKVRMMVHPFYTETDDTDRYVHGVEKLLASPSPQKLPLIVLEEGGSTYRETQKRFDHLVPPQDREKIAFVPTHVSDPLPIPEYDGLRNHKYYAKPGSDELKWKSLTDGLSSIGVRKIIIGGQYLGRVEFKGDDESLAHQLTKKGFDFPVNQILAYCVGATAHVLASEFDIEISNLAHPENRMKVLGLKK